MNLKVLRQKKGLTQKEVADFLGYQSPQMISNWERKACGVPAFILEPLSKLYGVPLKSLINLKTREHKRSLVRRIGGLK